MLTLSLSLFPACAQTHQEEAEQKPACSEDPQEDEKAKVEPKDSTDELCMLSLEDDLLLLRDEEEEDFGRSGGRTAWVARASRSSSWAVQTTCLACIPCRCQVRRCRGAIHCFQPVRDGVLSAP